MGANLVPMDNLLSRITDQRWETIVRQAVDANFNTPAGLGRRVLPRQPLLRAVRSIRPAGVAGLHGRLRQHLSDVGDGRGVHAGSHLQPEAAAPSRLPRPAVRQQRDGKRCHQLGFPGQPAGAGRLHPPVRPSAAGAVRDLCAGHLLLAVQPSSGGGFDDPDNPAKGDTHYWEVWHGGVPFTTYRQKRFRFCPSMASRASPP